MPPIRNLLRELKRPSTWGAIGCLMISGLIFGLAILTVVMGMLAMLVAFVRFIF